MRRLTRLFEITEGFLPWIFLAAYLLCCVFVWVEADWRPEWDGALYILTAKSLAAGTGYSYLDQPFFLRPPGLPWLISVVQGDHSFDPLLINRMIMFFAGTAVAAVYFAVGRSYPRWFALGIAVLAGTSPIFVGNFNWVRSEFPYMTLIFLGMGLQRLASGHSGMSWAAFGTGLCVAAAFYLRSVALILVPGMLLVGWTGDRKFRRWHVAIPTLVTIGLVLPWLRYAQLAFAKAEFPYEQLYLASYATAMFRVDPGDPTSALVPVSGWLSRISSNGSALLTDLGATTLAIKNASVGGLVALICFLGWCVAVRDRRSILEWYTFAYVILLLTYFSYWTRFLTPLVPFAYLYAFIFIRATGQWFAQRDGRRGVVSVLWGSFFTLLLLVNAIQLPHVLDPRHDHEKMTLRGRDWEAFQETANWIRKTTPKDAVLMCHQAPIFSVLAQRRVYTYQFPRRPDLLTRYAPDYVVIDVRPRGLPQLERLLHRHSTKHWVLRGESGWTTDVYRMQWARAVKPSNEADDANGPN